jgi:DNA-binding CsgD family transcriptional regulator
LLLKRFAVWGFANFDVNRSARLLDKRARTRVVRPGEESRMPDEKQLLTLITNAYDAALEPSLWPDVLHQAARFIGGPSAALWSKDVARPGAASVYIYGFDPGYADAILGEYGRLDPAAGSFFFAGIEEVVNTASIVSHAEFRSSRFYREWAKPQGLVDCMHVVLDKSASSVALFSVSRHGRNGIADDKARQRMRSIAPHIRRAMLIGRVIGLKAAEASTFADTLDGLCAGMFLVDACGHVVHANAAGQVMLRAGDFLRCKDGRLNACDPNTNKILTDIFAFAGDGDAALGIKGISVPLVTRDDDRYIAHVLPLTSGARGRAGATHAAVAALFIHKATLEYQSPPEIIAKAYKLTPTELRVLLAVVEIGGVPDVADALGIAASTVRTHLGRLYEKTGARRQAELVKLVARFLTPLIACAEHGTELVSSNWRTRTQ